MAKKMAVKKKKRKVSKKPIFVNFVLDETGSMCSCWDATISGFNEYISDLKKLKKNNYYISLLKFDSNRMDFIQTNTPIKSAIKLSRENYIPGALTPLYDAIAHAIKKYDKKKNVLCVIMTDGHENASQEYDRDKIFKLIKEKEKAGWTFAYLGANQDAWAVGGSLGLAQGNVINYRSTDEGTRRAFKKMSESTEIYACAVNANLGYSAMNFFNGDSDISEDEKKTSKVES
jgi:hypothetical protein